MAQVVDVFPPVSVRASASPKRDFRFDLARGAALLMMHVDHTPFFMWAGRFTLRRYSFADAFELFVLLSGLVCGITYATLLQRQGGFAAFRKSLDRVARLYATHAGLAIVSCLLVGAAANQSWPSVLRVLTFRQGSAVTILPLYVCFALCTPLFVSAWQRHRYLLITISAVTYVVGQSITLTAFCVSPLCAQAVFILGIGAGVEYQRGRLWRPGRNLYRVCCVALVAIAVARVLQSDRLALVFSQSFFHQLNFPLWDKHHVGFLRLCNAILWLVVVPPIVGAIKFERFRIARWVARAGMSPLAVYATSVLFSLILPVSAVRLFPGYLSGLIWDLGGISAMLGVGAFLHHRHCSRARVALPRYRFSILSNSARMFTAALWKKSLSPG